MIIGLIILLVLLLLLMFVLLCVYGVMILVKSIIDIWKGDQDETN